MMKKHEDRIIELALNILRNRLRKPGTAITSATDAQLYLIMKLAMLRHEVFVVLFLDNAHRVIAVDEMFRGTIDQASVYPREVVKAAILQDAAAVIFAHNHPAASCDPSDADIAITERLVKALGYVDVRVLDHIIVAGDQTTSFAERGLI